MKCECGERKGHPGRGLMDQHMQTPIFEQKLGWQAGPSNIRDTKFMPTPLPCQKVIGRNVYESVWCMRVGCCRSCTPQIADFTLTPTHDSPQYGYELVDQLKILHAIGHKQHGARPQDNTACWQHIILSCQSESGRRDQHAFKELVDALICSRTVSRR